MNLTQYLLPSKRDTKMKNLYIVYARKSTESEDRQVSSIQDQIDALKDKIISPKKLKVLMTFSEAKSAKKPNRPEFNKMIDLIVKRGDIKGVICWKLNRLSRNPKDEGQIRQLLSDGTIEEIITPDKTFVEADSDFIMAIEGAQAQRFISDLRKDSVRGTNSKIEKKWAPILAPAGYKNNTFERQGEKTISPHPQYFGLMRRLFEMAMTGNYSVPMLMMESRKLGIRNARGNFLSKTQISKYLTNPFYTGRFVYGGKLYAGAHEAMLTDAEFDLLQSVLQHRAKPQKVHEDTPFSKMITCGECGRSITYENKIKKSGWTGQYYRCTKWNQTKIICKQPCLRKEAFESQVSDFLGSIKISDSLVKWAVKKLNDINDKETLLRKNQQEVAIKNYRDSQRRLDSLLNLKLSPNNVNGELLTDEEYLDKKRTINLETQTFKNIVDSIDKGVDGWMEASMKCLEFAKGAQYKWQFGDAEDRRTILNAIGSKLILKDKKLIISAREPFLLIQNAVKNTMCTTTRTGTDFATLSVLGG